MSEFVEIALFTDDVEAARGFYEPLVGVRPEAEWPGGAIYAAGAVELLLHGGRSAYLRDPDGRLVELSQT